MKHKYVNVTLSLKADLGKASWIGVERSGSEFCHLLAV